MAELIITERSNIVAIADAVRSKTGNTNEMTIGDIIDDINNIDVGDGEEIQVVEQATPSISVSSSGLITASSTQDEGYVEAGTKSATKQLTTKGSTVITPNTSEQTAVAKGVYTTGAVVVEAIPSSYIQPDGTLNIYENGTYDISNYMSVVVDIKQKQTVYYWDVYNISEETVYSEKSEGTTEGGMSVSINGSWTLYYSSGYSFDSSTGKYTLTNPSSISVSSVSNASNAVQNKYFMTKSSSGSTMYYDNYSWSGTSNSYLFRYKTKYTSTSTTTVAQGSSTGATEKSTNQNAYPQDGQSGDYWYVYSHSAEEYV